MVVIFAVIAAIAAANVFILLSSTVEEKNYYGNLLRPITGAVAVVLALIVVYRQKVDGLFGRAYAGLAAGLVLYFIAEIIWGYYSIGAGIEVPFPSAADAFWLAGYVPLGYHLFRVSRLYGVGLRKRNTILVGAAVAIFSAAYIYNIIAVSELSSPDSMTKLAVSIAYPVFDAILIMPAILSILKSGKGKLTAVPWIFISWIFTCIADGLFGYTVVTNIAGDLSIWNLFYNAAYLFMAAGLYWHNKFFILDKHKLAELNIMQSGGKAA